MTKHYRLTGTAQIDGAVREAGYEFERPDDWVGPMKSVPVSCDLHAASIDAITDGKFEGLCGARFVDVPLYEEIVEPAESAVLALVDMSRQSDV